MHRLYYALAESLSGRAVRAAGVATSMLGKGRERFDMEMRALRADTAEDLALLQNGVLAGNYVWGLCDRVRLLSALTERLSHIIELLETATAGEAAPEFAAFRTAACRLPFPEEQLREDLQEGTPLPEILLILRMEAWQRALRDAYISAAALFLAKN